jgi:hypothetical protein
MEHWVKCEPWAHCARDSSGQLRRMIDFANRPVRCACLGFERSLSEEICDGNASCTSSYSRAVRMRGATVGISLLFGTAGTLMLSNVQATLVKRCVLRKTEHRLHKEDANHAKAKGKKATLAADHEWSVCQVSPAVNPCGHHGQSPRSGLFRLSPRQNPIEIPTMGLKSSAASVTPSLQPSPAGCRSSTRRQTPRRE